MNYQEWLDAIEELTKSNNFLILEKLEKEPINESINHLIEDKLINLINNRTQYSLNKIVIELNNMYSDQYQFDMQLIIFKKDIEFSLRLLKLKQISKEKYDEALSDLKKEVEESYKILDKTALEIDPNGNLSLIIKNNRIKWSDNNEL